MWIDDAPEDILRTWVKHSPTMELVSLLDGTILWANPAFCDWSQYTLSELRKMTLMQISVPDKNLEADIDETKRLDAYNPSYVVKKQYVPKSSAPEWGHLTVMRYPLTGDIQCCLCTWEPMRNGTAKAFTVAMEHYSAIDRKLEAMTAEIQTLTKQSDEDKFVLGTIRLLQRHPKAALFFLLLVASVFGLNNIVELLQRTGLLHLPVKVETQSAAHATEIADTPVVEAANRIETKSGTVIEWVSHERRPVGLSGTIGGVGAGSVGRRESAAAGGGAGSDFAGLPGRAL